MELGPTKNGDYVAPFTARYYQTLPTVTTGQANGMATLTLSYSRRAATQWSWLLAAKPALLSTSITSWMWSWPRSAARNPLPRCAPAAR